MAELKTYDVTVNGFPTQLRLTPEQAAEIGAPEHVAVKPKRPVGRRTTRRADVVPDPVKTNGESPEDDEELDDDPADDGDEDESSDETPKE